MAQKAGYQFKNFIFRIGPAQTRLVSQILYTGAWVALAFYRVQQYLIYCWMLLAFSGMISNEKKISKTLKYENFEKQIVEIEQGFAFLLSNYTLTSQSFPTLAGN